MSFIGVRLILGCSLALARRARVRKQRHLAGVLDRRRDVPLVARAVARHPAGADLAAVRDVLAEQAGVLVVDVGRPVVAERADLLLRLANGWLGHRGALLRAPPAAGMLGCLYLWLGLEGRFVGVAAGAVGGPRVGLAAPAAVTALIPLTARAALIPLTAA